MTFSRTNQEVMLGDDISEFPFVIFDSGYYPPPTPQLPGPKAIGQSFSLFLQTQWPCPVWLPLAPLLLEIHYFSCSRNIKSENCQRGEKSPNNHRWQTWKFNLKSFFIIQNIKIKAIMPKGKHRLKPPMFHKSLPQGVPKTLSENAFEKKAGVLEQRASCRSLSQTLSDWPNQLPFKPNTNCFICN